MSNPYIGWVNLQMVSVRHHLGLLIDEANANDRLRNRGVLESAAWHLSRAYCYYLYELGANYQLPSPESNCDAQSLSGALESVGKHPGEAGELCLLESEGWIRDLHRALGNETGARQGAGVQSGRVELQLIDLDNQVVVLSKEVLEQWLVSFKELVDRHREVMVEY